MISFVWSDPFPIFAGRGGTESFTIGYIRELKKRGIDAQLLSYGLGEDDGRANFPDIDFRNLDRLEELENIDDTVVYLNYPHDIKTKQQSYVMFHFPIIEKYWSKQDYKKNIGNSIIIANSRFLRSYLADYFDVDETSILVVYPFADPAFSTVKRVKPLAGITRVLYAGRLNPEKGIYTLLEALHHPIPDHRPPTESGFIYDIVSAGDQTLHGKVIAQLLRHHPWVNLLKSRGTPTEMAELFASHEVVVMPSNHKFWHDAFGMVSVEAQHAGCRVIASNDGGLPETNCGELILFSPGNSLALYRAIAKAAKLGPLDPTERDEAGKHFTLAESIDSFIKIIKNNYKQ
jgi:D-inositol-3-phosphate glycosyltransferase